MPAASYLIYVLALWAVYGAAVRIEVSNITALTVIPQHSDVYTVTEKVRDVGDGIIWVDVGVQINDRRAHKRLVQEQIPIPATVNSTFFVEQPVYISLTTMASRMNKINRTINSLIQARVLPTSIYLLISKEPYLLDEGVQQIPDQLLCLVAEGYLQIVYTQNLGPHRKLLPALKRHWGEDVFIATVDDDMRRDQGYMILYQLLKHYVLGGGGERVVALRTRRIGLCTALPYRITKYYSWPVQLSYNRQEMLVMPTGTGGILYKPSYFHKVVFHKSLRFATGTADDLMFRLATMVKRVPVQLGCSTMRYRGRVIRECPEDEHDRLYDAKYGPYSSEYFKRLSEEITKQMQADIAAAEALKAAEAAAQSTRVTRGVQSKDKAERDENEHDNDGDGEAEGHKSSKGRGQHRRVLTTAQFARPSDVDELSRTTAGTDSMEGRRADAEEWAVGNTLQLAATHNSEQWGPSLSNLGQDGQHHSAVNPDEVGERRRLAKVIRYRGVPRNGTELDLFSINRRGGNDMAWRLAVEVLSAMRVMDIEEITAEYVGEREKFCYARRRSVPMERFCALFDCDKPKQVTVGNVTVTQMVTAIKRQRLLQESEEVQGQEKEGACSHCHTWEGGQQLGV
jgi:hypothetical protein